MQDSNPATDEASARAAEITKIRAIINEKASKSSLMTRLLACFHEPSPISSACWHGRQSGFIRSRDLDRFETDNKQVRTMLEASWAGSAHSYARPSGAYRSSDRCSFRVLVLDVALGWVVGSTRRRWCARRRS